MQPGTISTNEKRDGGNMNNRLGMSIFTRFHNRSHDAGDNTRNQPKGSTVRLHSIYSHRSIQHGLLAFVVGFATLFSTVVQATPASAAAGTNTLYTHERLYGGQRLISSDGRYHLVMQGDGNLVIYAPGNVPIWATGTNGRPGAWLGMQGDGNLVIYAPGLVPIWATGTYGSGMRLVMQTDGNLVLYTSQWRAIWSSKGGRLSTTYQYPSQYASTTGAAASCSLVTWTGSYNFRNSAARINCRLSDTLSDDHSVYVEWWQDGYGHVKMRNSQGSGTTIYTSDTRYSPDGSFVNIYFKVCRDVQVGFDNCSYTRSWRMY